MPNLPPILDWNQIFNGITSNILSAFLLGLLGLIFIDQKRVLRPWIAHIFNNEAIARYIIKLIDFITAPFFRFIIASAFLAIIFLQTKNILLPLGTFLILTTFLVRPKKTEQFLPVPQLIDGFSTLENWIARTGSPQIEDDFGKPSPDLALPYAPGQATNSFIFHKQINNTAGIMECDFYLEEGSILNIVFFANPDSHNWYMARFDSRNNDSDGFIIKDLGPGNNWRLFKMSGTQTSTKTWHRARLEFSPEKVAMYKDGELLVEFSNPQIFGESIGFFNELGLVHVDNFSFIEN